MRLLLFGVDGLAFRVINPLIERGLLPNFQRVRDGGVQSILKSTTTPMTPPAWMSISTGLSLAKHGVYDFWQYEQTENGPKAALMTHRQGGKAIWNILSEWGRRVIVANVPITYPTEPVNGIMLSGLMAPSMEAAVTYPAEFKEELLQAVPDYQIDLAPAVTAMQVGDLFAEALKMTRSRIELLRLLLDKPWDFLFIVFTAADRIQHPHWEKVMQFHPQAVAYYQMLDEALGIALESLDADDVLMIVSDHGFQGADRMFYLQEYLRRRGLLRVRDINIHRRQKFLALIKDQIRKLVWALGLYGVPTLLRRQLYRMRVIPVKTVRRPVWLPDLDWKNTHAWLLSLSSEIIGYADIFLDDSLTEEQIDEIIAALREIRDPETGQQLIVEIHREDAFGAGPFAPKERHIVALCGEGMTVSTDLITRKLWKKTSASHGIHHSDGVLYLYGAGVKRGVNISPTHVYDVVPTILSRMGIPLPEGLDGVVIEEAFEIPIVTSAKGNGKSEGMRKLKKLALDI